MMRRALSGPSRRPALRAQRRVRIARREPEVEPERQAEPDDHAAGDAEPDGEPTPPATLLDRVHLEEARLVGLEALDVDLPLGLIERAGAGVELRAVGLVGGDAQVGAQLLGDRKST